MTLPVIGNTTAKLAISLTAGQAKAIGFASDVDLPEGTYTLTVGETDIPTTRDDARTLSVAFPAENAALLWQQWRLRLDGSDFAGGPIIETLPNNPAGDTTEPLTVNLGDSVVNLTVTIAAGGGQRFGASVILATADLTPTAGDPVYWVAYTPGHVDAGGPEGSQRVPNDWAVVQAYEWGDESWNPPTGGTDVLLLLGEDSWPTVFATATNGALTVKDVPGLTVVPVGCGGAYGSGEGTALWMARNFEGFNGAPSPDAPAIDFVPVVIGDQSVLTGGWSGALADMHNLRTVLTALDDGTIGGGTTEDYTPILVDGSTGDQVPTGPATWGRFTVINGWCHWECRFELLDTVPEIGSMLLVLPASVKQMSGQLRDCGTGLAILGTPVSPGELASLSVTGGDLTGAFGSPVPAYVAVFDTVDPPGPPASLGTRTPLDFSIEGGFLKFRGQFEIEPA